MTAGNRFKALVLLFGFVLSLKAQTVEAALLAIQGLIQAGDLPAASEQISISLKRWPGDAGILNLRGIVHARNNELSLAKKDFDAAVRANAELKPAWQNLGRTCQELKELSCAVQAWQRVLRLKSNDDEAHQALAALYANQGHFAESLSELNAARDDNLSLRCSDLVSLGRIPEAKDVAARIAQQPDFTEKDLDDWPTFRSAQSAGVLAVLLETLDKRGMAGPTTLERLVVVYEQLHRTSDAKEVLERVARLDPNNTKHLLELARLAELNKEYQEALGYLAHARGLEPANAKIHFLFGFIASELNLPVEAKSSFKQALSIEPNNPDYNYAMGSIILMTRDAATAADYLQKVVRAKPADARAHYALGLAYLAYGDYDGARKQMGSALSTPAVEPAADYQLGRIARLEGKLDQARVWLHKSLRLMPTISGAFTELAKIDLIQSDFEDAKSQLQNALRLEPESFQANEQLLILYRRSHDPRANEQAAQLKKLDEDRSRRAELMLRTIEVEP